MIATTVAYDIVFLVHIIAAVATIVVLIALRTSAGALMRQAELPELVKRFPNRSNMAARVLHVLPLTGIYMAATGGHDVSFSRPWVGVGILCYLAAAGHLEARTLPEERRVAQALAAGNTPGANEGRRFGRSIDVLLGLITVALISMIVQF